MSKAGVLPASCTRVWCTMNKYIAKCLGTAVERTSKHRLVCGDNQLVIWFVVDFFIHASVESQSGKISKRGGESRLPSIAQCVHEVRHE